MSKKIIKKGNTTIIIPCKLKTNTLKEIKEWLKGKKLKGFKK